MSTMLNHLNDRLNPVLVKEIRQAVRGKFFRSSFIFTLIIASIVASVMLANLDLDRPRGMAKSGPQFFFGMHLVFVFVAFLIVPQHASRSMSSEREGRTFDALVTSGLAPAQIILGKWLASGMLLMLFLSAFAPFLVVGFTLYGLDMSLSLTLLLFTVLIGMGLNLIGILTACVAKKKAAIAMMQGLFTLASLLALWAWLFLASMAQFDLSGITGGNLFVSAAVALCCLLLFYFWLYGVTISTITHSEENGMLRVRIACLVISVFWMVLTLSFFWDIRDPDVLTAMAVGGICLLTLLNIPLLTESDRLGVRCVHQIRQGQWRKPFAWLFLPSGATAYPLFLLQLVIILLPLLIPSQFFSGPTLSSSVTGLGTTTPMTHATLASNGLAGVFAVLFVCLTMIGIPASVAASPRCTAAHRNGWRVFIPTIPLLLTLLCMVIGLLLNDRQMANGQSGFNPFWMVGNYFFGQGSNDSFSIWLIVAGFSTLVQIRHALGQRKKIHQLRRQAVIENRDRKLAEQAKNAASTDHADQAKHAAATASVGQAEPSATAANVDLAEPPEPTP